MVSPTRTASKKDLETRALNDKLAALNPPAPPTGQPVYPDFDSYVRDYPEGERFRAWVTNRGHAKTVVLFLGTDVAANALPGHYLWATLTECPGGPGKAGVVQLSLHDDDDGLAIKRWPAAERARAEQLLDEMKLLAPFGMLEAITVFQLQRE
jgi:hypothetical protein